MAKGKPKYIQGQPQEVVILLAGSGNMAAPPAHKDSLQTDYFKGDQASEQSMGIEYCTATPTVPTPQDGDFSGGESPFS